MFSSILIRAVGTRYTVLPFGQQFFSPSSAKASSLDLELGKTPAEKHERQSHAEKEQGETLIQVADMSAALCEESDVNLRKTA